MAGTREAFDHAWTPYLITAIVIGALVIGTMGFAVLRYRVRRDGSSRGTRSLPAWLSRAEVGYVVVVATIIAGALTLTFRSQSDIAALGSDPPAATIDVTAFQWGWRFDYGGGAVVIGNSDRQPTLIVPIGELVRFNLTSRDVIHSFWIPEESFKRDAFPEKTTTFGLVFDDTPSVGRCAEFCGIDHYRMDFNVLPVSPAAFESFLAKQRARAQRQVAS